MQSWNRETRDSRGGKRAMAVAMLTAVIAACSRATDKTASADTAAASAASSSESTVGPPAERRVGARRTVLFAGTSLTAGLGLDADSAYPMLIQQKIDSARLAIEVVNAGVSGETSSGLLDRLDWLLRGKFDVMVIETGANDGLRGIPASTVRSNLVAIVDRIRAKRPDASIVLIQMEALPNLGPQYASEFHRVYGEVAKMKGVRLLPFLLQDVAGHRQLNQPDGVHPNYVGERMVATNVWKELAPVLDSLDRAHQAR